MAHTHRMAGGHTGHTSLAGNTDMMYNRLGSRWIGPLFAIVVFFYGGLPFLQMAVPEVRNRKPGMMTLISLAITVAFVYSVFALLVAPEGGFFWEMATLIAIMLLGHWIEMRSVRQASGALNELVKLMPDTAERILVVRLMGAHVNRRAIENVRIAGLEIERSEDLAPGGLVKLTVVRAGKGSMDGVT